MPKLKAQAKKQLIVFLQKKIKELSIFAISRNNVLNRKKEHLQDIYDAQTTLYEEWAKNKSFAKAGIKFNL